MHTKFMQKHNIQCYNGMEDTISDMVKAHIEGVVHHVVSIAALVAMMNGRHQIESKDMQAARTYVISKCGGHIKGGMSMASDFYGYPHAAYSPSHANQGVQSSQISWARNEARPALGPVQMGGQNKKNKDKEITKLIKEQIQKVGATTARGVVDHLHSIIELHLVCFADDLKKVAPLTIKKVEKILAKRRHAAFQ